MNRFLISSLLLLITVLHVQAARLQGQARIDYLLNVVANAKEDTQLVEALNRLSFSYRDVDTDKGLAFGVQGLALAEKLSFQKGIGDAYNMLGLNYEIQSDLSKALDYYLRALKISEARQDLQSQACILNNIGNVYHSLGELDKGIAYFEKSLAINRKTGFKPWPANNLINIGNIYGARGDYLKSIDYYLQAKQILEELNNKAVLALVLANLGSVAGALDEHEQCLEFLLLALENFRELGDKTGIALCESNLGGLFFNIAVDSSNKYLLPEFGGRRKEGLLRAKMHLEAAIRIDKELKGLSELSTDSKMLSEVLFELGDAKGALEQYRIYSEYKDSVFNLEKDKKLTETAMQYEFEKKEAAAKAEQEKEGYPSAQCAEYDCSRLIRRLNLSGCGV